MSLLTIIQGVALRVNYGGTPTSAFSNTDPAVQLMVACAQDAGDDASERADWSLLKLQSPATFTGDGTSAAFALPAGFGRLSPSDTFVSNAYPTMQMPGPINEDDLLVMKSIPVTTKPSAWRQVGVVSQSTGMLVQMIEFFPILSLNEIVSYVYAGKLWVTNASGAQYSTAAWQADTDISLIPERIIRLGAIWRWKKSKGLDYSEEMTDYEGALDRLSGQESTGRVISMSRITIVDPDTWFPGTITDFTNQSY